MTAGAIALIVLAVFVLIIAMAGVRIVPQARAGIVERLGRYTRTLDAGLTLIVPFIDRVKPLIDLREQVVAFPPQPVITEDNLVVGIDTVIYFTVTDPKAATYEIANPLQAIEQLTVTTLRNVIGGLTLEETLTSRDNINSQLRVVLDEATGKWGIRVNRVELKSVEPPRTVQEAMEKQMRAERDRRAAILTAEGIKQSQILTAEGEKQAAVLKAEGARTAAILRAEGESKAIETVFPAIHDGQPDQLLLSYQYLQMLPAARAGLGQQGLRDPVGVLAGARAHQRRARAAAAARRRGDAQAAAAIRQRRRRGGARGRRRHRGGRARGRARRRTTPSATQAAADAAGRRAAADAARRPAAPARDRQAIAGPSPRWTVELRAGAAPPRAAAALPARTDDRPAARSSCCGSVRLPRREAPGHPRRRPPARRADRGRHQRRDARDPPRAARGRRQLQGRQAVHVDGARSAAGAPRSRASSTPASRSSRSSTRS